MSKYEITFEEPKLEKIKTFAEDTQDEINKLREVLTTCPHPIGSPMYRRLKARVDLRIYRAKSRLNKSRSQDIFFE